MENAAALLAVNAKLMWTHYSDVGKAESLLAVAGHCAENSLLGHPKEDRRVREEHAGVDEHIVASVGVLLDEWEMVEMPQDDGLEDDTVVGVAAAMDVSSEQYLAKSLVDQLRSEIVVMAAAEAESKYVQQSMLELEKATQEGVEERNGCGLSDDVAVELDIVEESEVNGQLAVESITTDISTEQEREIARTLADQLKREWAVVTATQAQTRYLEIVGAKDREEKASGQDTEVSEVLELSEDQIVEEDVVTATLVMGGESTERLNLDDDLIFQAQASSRLDDMVGKDKSVVSEEEISFSETDRTELDSDNHSDEEEKEGGGELSEMDQDETDQSKLILSSSVLATPIIRPVMCDAATNTIPDQVQMSDAETNTVAVPLTDRGSSPAPPPPVMIHAYAQTVLSIEDLESRVEEKKELELLKVDLHVARKNLTQERSQRLVAEELVKIIQTDLNATSGRNTAEVMARMQAENELTEVKVSDRSTEVIV